MSKEIILYNLKDSVTDEEYKKYCEEKKGPFLQSLPSCKSFTLVKIVASKKGEIPYKYVGILDATSTADWQKDTQSEDFQKFLQEWVPKVKEDFQILMGEEVFGK
ncbi:MAG: EthD family reductase [Pseudomonadota bacterium]